MNPRWKENPIFLQFLLGCLLFLFLSVLSYIFGIIQPSVSGLALFARSNSTRTAIALTYQALMGPFPTATGPTPTPSWTPSMTSTPTPTPTVTPTPTAVRYFLNTSTPRTSSLKPARRPSSCLLSQPVLPMPLPEPRFDLHRSRRQTHRKRQIRHKRQIRRSPPISLPSRLGCPGDPPKRTNLTSPPRRLKDLSRWTRVSIRRFAPHSCPIKLPRREKSASRNFCLVLADP